jgi:hypothetical protein
VWIFLHTLAARISEEGYRTLQVGIYHIVERILALLPCPECSADALSFFRTIPKKTLYTKVSLANALYLLHNKVNAKLRKPLFNSTNLSTYEYANLGKAYGNFVQVFNTTSTRIMADNMQRRMFLKQMDNWLVRNRWAFMEIIRPNMIEPISLADIPITEETSPDTELVEEKQPIDPSVSHSPIDPSVSHSPIDPSVSHSPIDPSVSHSPIDPSVSPSPIEQLDDIPSPSEETTPEPSIDINLTDIIPDISGSKTLVVSLSDTPIATSAPEKRRGGRRKKEPVATK